MTDRADDRLRSREELSAMARNARRVLWIICHILKGSVTSAHLVPVGRRKFMTGTAGDLVLRNVVREFGISLGLLPRPLSS